MIDHAAPSPLPPQSPEMTKEQPRRKLNSSSSNHRLPPRPPPVQTNTMQPASSDDDLSFADFTKQEGDTPASLSGFLEDDEPNSFLFRRTRKVNAVDVASVGNASDTLVHKNMSGRDLHEQAKMAFNENDYQAALSMFEAILNAQIRRFSALHPSVGAAMHNVGVCRQRLGQHAMAENLFQEAVQIRKKTLGKEHLEVAASLSKLGAAQTALRKFDDAFDQLRLALSIAKSNLGESHKTVAQMLCHLACLFFEADELMASEATFQDALTIYRKVWKKADNRDACMMQLTDTLCNIGSIQNRRKRFETAVESFSEALDLQLGIVGPDDSRIISTLDNLGYSYSKLKNYDAALTCYRKMFRAQVSNTGNFTEACLETFRKEILMFEKLRRYTEAIDETKECLVIQKRFLARDDRLVVHTKELLEELKAKSRSTS